MFEELIRLGLSAAILWALHRVVWRVGPRMPPPNHGLKPLPKEVGHVE